MRSDQSPRRSFDCALYRERHQIERCSNHLKQYRRVATRYQKLAAT
jgi:transposase